MGTPANYLFSVGNAIYYLINFVKMWNVIGYVFLKLRLNAIIFGLGFNIGYGVFYDLSFGSDYDVNDASRYANILIQHLDVSVIKKHNFICGKLK